MTEAVIETRPECTNQRGCKALEEFVVKAGLTSQQQQELINRCREYTDRVADESRCVIRDSHTSTTSFVYEGGPDA